MFELEKQTAVISSHIHLHIPLILESVMVLSAEIRIFNRPIPGLSKWDNWNMIRRIDIKCRERRYQVTYHFYSWMKYARQKVILAEVIYDHAYNYDGSNNNKYNHHK